MKKLISLLLSCVIVGSMLGQSALAIQPDSYSATLTDEQSEQDKPENKEEKKEEEQQSEREPPADGDSENEPYADG